MVIHKHHGNRKSQQQRGTNADDSLWQGDMISKPTAADAQRLGRDIELLIRDCERVFQATWDKDQTALAADKRVKTSAASMLNDEFFIRAVCVCNADGSISEEEGSLFRELFGYLKTEFRQMTCPPEISPCEM